MEDKIQEISAACKETLKTMISLDRRRESFTDWPLSKDVSSENMAKAGWYQVGPLTTRHCVTMKELHGWEETDNAMEETLKRKLENPLFLYKKWTPGIEILSKPDSEILVGERMRLQAAMILGHMQWQIDEISEWQQSLIDSTIQRLKEKHNDDQDLLEGKIEKFTNLIQLKFDVQNKNMEDIRKQLLSKATKKYAKKKKNGPNWFITDENDAFLEEKFDEPWVSLMKPKMPLPKQKSRQSVLAGQSNVTKEAPSAKKAKNTQKTSQFSSIPSIPE